LYARNKPAQSAYAQNVFYDQIAEKTQYCLGTSDELKALRFIGGGGGGFLALDSHVSNGPNQRL